MVEFQSCETSLVEEWQVDMDPLQVCLELSIPYLRLMESTCLCMILPYVSSTTYERGPVTSIILQEIHLGDFHVNFSANTLSPTLKLRNDFDESCDSFCLSIFHFLG